MGTTFDVGAMSLKLNETAIIERQAIITTNLQLIRRIVHGVQQLLQRASRRRGHSRASRYLGGHKFTLHP
jgi:hypothetical protein